MSKHSFVLKEPGSNKDNPILLLFTCTDGRIRYYTGVRANKKTFNQETQLASDKSTRAQLTRISQLMDNIVVDYRIKGEQLSRKIVIDQLDRLLHKKTKSNEEIDLFERLTDIVDKMESGRILTPDKRRYSPGSIKTFRFTIGFLQSFDPHMKQSRITLETYRRFIVWCQQGNYAINYIGSQIKNWKTLGKAVGGNPIFDHPEFKKITEETFDIYLTEEELQSMYKLKLSDRETLVRDWFILDCYTGLRVSDLVLLNRHNIHKGLITIANKKTDEKVIIPVHPFVKAIMDKHKGFPPVITDVEINREIKKVAKAAGIDDNVLFTITKGGKRKDEYLEKWQMVSCHTARRSFITNLLKNGVPETIVMKLTGIKSSQTLKRYNKLSVDEAARIAAGHAFFK